MLAFSSPALSEGSFVLVQYSAEIDSTVFRLGDEGTKMDVRFLFPFLFDLLPRWSLEMHRFFSDCSLCDDFSTRKLMGGRERWDYKLPFHENLLTECSRNCSKVYFRETSCTQSLHRGGTTSLWAYLVLCHRITAAGRLASSKSAYCCGKEVTRATFAPRTASFIAPVPRLHAERLQHVKC